MRRNSFSGSRMLRLLPALAAAFILAACGGGGNKPAGTDKPAAQEETAAESASGEETSAEETSGAAGESVAAQTKTPADGTVFFHGGFTFPALDTVKQYEGRIYTEIYDEPLDNGLYYSSMLFLPWTEEELMAMTEEDEIAEVQDSIREVFTVMAIDGGRGEEDMKALLSELGAGSYQMEELGKNGEYTFFWVEDPDMTGPLSGEADEMYRAVRAEAETKKKEIAFGTPQGYATLDVGSTVSFRTADMEGNEVSSEELFASHRVTMVNVWTSWCPPCKAELPELEKINAEFAGRGGAVVGLLYDSPEEGAIESAEATIAETGVTYQMLLAPDQAENIFPLEAFPTTWFFDGEGKVVAGPVVGADVQQYRDILERLLRE